jgi:YgiT-type zinc finger domain-containing protein
MKAQPCPECRGTTDRGTHAHKITYKHASRVVELECWKCSECGELMMCGTATLKFSETLQELKLRIANDSAHAAL